MDWPYSEHFIKEFLDLYGTMPSLWNQSSKEFRDFGIRARDFAVLLRKFQEVEPEATKPYLLKKLNLLRRQYRDEIRKCEQQGRSMRKRFEPLRFLPDPPPIKRRKQNTRDPLDIDSTSENDDVVVVAENSADYIKLPEQDVQLDTSIKAEMNVENHIDLDRFDHVTKAWTKSLLSMPREQQKITERIINNILFEAQVGNLSKRSPTELFKLFNKDTLSH